jgi:integrase
MRHRRAVWRAKPPELCRVLLPNWCWTLDDGRKVPSGHINWSYLRHYLGWLTLAEAKGGRGISVEAVQSIAWLTLPDLLEQYLHWTAERAGNFNAFTRGILDVTVSLLNPTTGFFPQQPQLLDRLPEDFRPAVTWQAHCADAYARLYALRKVVTPSIVPTRDPEAPIRELLGEKNPLRAIFEMLRAMEEAMPSATAPQRRAIHLRDMVLVALLLGNPLRISQYITLQYGAGTREHLYRTKDGAWRIRQEPDTFKNGRTTARKPYSVEVARVAWPYIERYLAEARPLLLGGQQSRYLLVGQGAGIDSPVSNLDDRLQVLTARYIPGSPGFRAQAMRALVSTAWLRVNPRDYLTVSLLLNDSLQTVLRAYSHLEAADGLSTYAEWLSRIIAKGKKPLR